MENEVTNLEQARKLNLDVYAFPHYAEYSRVAFATGLKAQGRKVYAFSEQVAGYTLLWLAATPRPSAQISKTIRQFVKEENNG